jgi:hypothetical protein
MIVGISDMAQSNTTENGNPNLPFWIRIIGLSGFFAVIIGLVLIAINLLVAGIIIAAIGAVCAVAALIFETKSAINLIGGQRGAFGSNVGLQILLAAALLIGINFLSFRHYRRFDWTYNQSFTLPAKIRDRMTQLQGETTIVVYHLHKPFGQLKAKPDKYDKAAERKVIEKVNDLVDQFRDLGRQFHVEVLDVEDDNFSQKLDKLTEDKEALRKEIDASNEDSIFFYGDGNVQRLGFHDIYQLDKQSSQEEKNLVLLDQGVEPFANEVLQVDQKKPKIALATIHEILGTEGSEELGMTGFKKALQDRGFETVDIILKKWSEFMGPEPAVLTYDESKYERVDAQLSETELTIKSLEQELKDIKEVLDLWKTATLDDLTKKYADQLKGRKVTEAIRTNQVAILQQNRAILELYLSGAREERDGLLKEKDGLKVENLQEQKRISDLKAKTERMLADCDLLVIPRFTLLNVARGELIPNRIYKLDDSQVAAIKDFLKAGKPVLLCFGPSNEPVGRMDPMGMGPDKLEDALEEVGIHLSKQTILFNIESKSFAERRSGIVILGTNVEVPPVKFDWEPGAGLPGLASASRPEPAKPNPIRESMRLIARGFGKDQKLDLRIRHPRPIYFEPKGTLPAFQSVFMMSDDASWNENDPFPSRDRTPRFEAPKSNDFTKGTVDEKRRGPFPIGVAVETSLPASWYTEKGAKPAMVRVAAIGHGGLFVGADLPPVKEKLLLDVCNWLLGRDDLLTKDHEKWRFPRVMLTDVQKSFWDWGTRLLIPLSFAFVGLVVLMVRRLR